MIEYSEFAKVDLRIGKILKVEKVPGTDKLVKLEVDLGDEKRTLVAGIAHVYKEEELLGKLVVVVANLKPKTIRGITSEGMLLAAVDGDKIALLEPDKEVKPGTKVL